MKCLVTGASGFLGTNLVHLLTQKDYKVRAFGLPGSETKYIDIPGVEIMEGDITNKEDVDRAVSGMELVFNIAGDTSFWKKLFKRQYDINVNGPSNVAEACIKHGVKRLVHTGTIDALGYNPDGLADETWDRYNYAGLGYNYADTKREGEKRVMSYNDKGLDVVVIYPGSMLGPYDYTLQFGRLFMELRDNKVPACPCGGIGYGHVTEVARAHMNAAEKGSPGQGYICAGVNTTYREMFELIANKFGKHAPKHDMPPWFFTMYGFFSELFAGISGKHPGMNPGQARFMSIKAYYDSGKAQRELDYKILPLSKMVDDAYDWYIENGFL